MTMGGIQDNHIHLGLYQSRHTLQHIGCDTHGRAAEQSSLSVLCGQRVLNLLLNILDGNESFQVKIVIYYRQLLNPGLCQNRLRLLKGNPLLGSNQIPGVKILLKLQIAVCDDANQPLTFCNRYTGDTEL